MKNKLLYRPEVGVAADFIPYYEDGIFYLFFLQDFRNKKEYGEGTPWNLITTSDFINFKEYGEVIPRGKVDDQDLYIFTGSVFKEAPNKYHIFYTGHNPHYPDKGKKQQAVMHAISEDLINWEKIDTDTFYAPIDDYEVHDWRDPFVYFDEDDKSYKMLLAARKSNGLEIRRGCVAVCSSNDLKDWTVDSKPLWEPNQYFTHECPDLFQIGDWWYLIYSEFSDQCMTRYVMSKDKKNWQAPMDDVFDGRAYYAAKTAANSQKRYIFGWVPTKKEEKDGNRWQWGGDLVVHEVFQKPNGELGARLPKQLYSIFNHVDLEKSTINLTVDSGYVHQLLEDFKNETFILECDIEISPSVTSCGILVNYNEETDRGYAFEFDQRDMMFRFIMQPNTPWNYSNFYNVWRTYESKKKHKLVILFDGEIAVAYLNDKLALSTRMYDLKGKLGFYSIDGNAKFSDIKIKRIKKG